MKNIWAVLVFLLLCTVSELGWSQNYCIGNNNPNGSDYCTPPQTGVPPLGSTGGGPFDVINQGTLNVNFLIPVFSRPGRGLNFNYALAYNNWLWYPIFSSTTQSMQWQHVPNWGWDTTTQLSGYYTSQQTQPGTCSAVPLAIMYANWTYHDTFGTAHVFPWTLWSDSRCGSTSASTLAPDGSGYTMTANTTPSVSASVLSRSGTTITLSVNSSTLKDSNGNENTFNGSAFFDTQSATTPVLSVSGSQSTSLTYSYTNPQPGTSNVAVNYSTYTIQTNSGCGGVTEWPATPNIRLPSSITMPDQSQYLFSYEETPGATSSSIVTGRIHSVTLPTGGVYTYNYPTQYINGTTPVTGGDTWCLDGTSMALQRVTPDGTWNYTRVYPGPEMDVQAPDATVTKIWFPGNGPSSNYATQQTVWPSGATTPISASRTFYNGCVWWTQICNFVLPITQTGVTNEFNVTMNSSSGNIATSLMAENDSVFTLSGLPLSAKEYDFGTNAKGALLRETDIDSYVAWDRPHTVTTKDGGGNVKKQTTYTYDQYGLTPSGAPQLTTVSAARGNSTTISYLVQGTSTLNQTIKYYDTGLPYTSTDVNGTAVTTNTYGSCGNSFLTNSTVTPPNLSVSATWDCDGGVPASITDESGKQTLYGYSSDPFWRLVYTTDPLNNVTSTIYHSPAQAESYMNFGANSTVDHEITMDGLGRPSVMQRRQLVATYASDSVQRTYDTLGRLYHITAPYYSAQLGGTAPNGTPTAETYTYDALSRPLQRTDGGGGTITNKYTANTANDVLITIGPIVSGENLKQRQLEYDALGRLTSVCELTSTANGGGACAQSTPQTGYLTKYVYGTNSLTVTENAQSGSFQIRIYTYDDLGRLTSETNPESGKKTYVYDADSNCGTSNGDLVKRTDYAGNVTCYAYDALHRVTTIKYPSGPNAANTATKNFVYDAATLTGNIVMQNTKGRLAAAYTCVTNCTVTTTYDAFSYSARGEVTDTYLSTNNSAGFEHFNASYWASGVMASLSGLPMVPTVYFGLANGTGLDGEGRVTKIADSSGQTLLAGVNYTTTGSSQPTGSLTQLSFGSGDSDNYSYDVNTSRLTQYQFNMGASPNTKSNTGNLIWNKNGSLLSLAISDQVNPTNTQNCSYSYDDIRRLSKTACGSVWTQTFSFDSFGNISKGGSSAFQATYSPSTNHISSLSGVAAPTYDSNGNLLTIIDSTSHNYTWDAEGKPLTMDGAAVTYDALGRAVEINKGGSNILQFVYDPTGHRTGYMQGQTFIAESVSFPGGAQKWYYPSYGNPYVHKDWLGTERLATTPTQTLVTDTGIAPYGEDYADSGPVFTLNFTGQDEDTVSGTLGHGLIDFPAREYSPIQGRWISPDPAGSAAVDLTNPQSFNGYTYVRNNPLAMVDPTGLDGCDWGDPISCVLTYGAYGGFGGAGLLGFSGPLSAGAVGNGGDDGWTFCCGDRNIVTAIYQTPGGAPRIKIAGPSQRVMSCEDNPVNDTGMSLSQNILVSKVLSVGFWTGILTSNVGVTTLSARTYINLVKTGGDWDPKNWPGIPGSSFYGGYVAAGNINFGATCSQFGFNTWFGGEVCQYGAGAYGHYFGNRPAKGIPFSGPSHGDQPADNMQIRQGLALGNC